MSISTYVAVKPIARQFTESLRLPTLFFYPIAHPNTQFETISSRKAYTSHSKTEFDEIVTNAFKSLIVKFVKFALLYIYVYNYS